MAGLDRNDQNLPDRLRALERKLDALMKGAPLRNASITEGGIRVGGDGYLRSTNWDGSGLADPGTEGWALGGPEGIAIINTLFLRAGIVGNEALSSPIGWCWAHLTENAFSVATSGELRAQTTLPVAEGFTQVAVIVAVTAGASNTRASGDYLFAAAVLDGGAAAEMPGYAGPGLWASATSIRVGLVGGLSGAAGQSVPIAANLHSQGGAWAATSGNRVHVAALGIAFR